MNITINTDSWHYRLLNFWDAKHNFNFCTYFWKVMFYPLVTLSVAFFALMAAIMILYIMAAPFLLYYTSVAVDSGVVILGTLLWCSVALIIFFWLNQKYEWLVDISDAASDTLIAQKIQATKDRICPRIELD